MPLRKQDSSSTSIEIEGGSVSECSARAFVGDDVGLSRTIALYVLQSGYDPHGHRRPEPSRFRIRWSLFSSGPLTHRPIIMLAIRVNPGLLLVHPFVLHRVSLLQPHPYCCLFRSCLTGATFLSAWNVGDYKTGSRQFRSCYSGSSIRSECFLSRSCSSAKTFSSHFACFSATHLSTHCGLCPMKNSSPQPSHLTVPISWKPVVFSRPLFFIATARMFQF
jgi:hypothetical protein